MISSLINITIINFNFNENLVLNILIAISISYSESIVICKRLIIGIIAIISLKSDNHSRHRVINSVYIYTVTIMVIV
jgi:hypothetical protein